MLEIFRESSQVAIESRKLPVELGFSIFMLFFQLVIFLMFIFAAVFVELTLAVSLRFQICHSIFSTFIVFRFQMRPIVGTVIDSACQFCQKEIIQNSQLRILNRNFYHTHMKCIILSDFTFCGSLHCEQLDAIASGNVSFRSCPSGVHGPSSNKQLM